MLNRRRFLAAAAGLCRLGGACAPGSAAAAGLDGITTASMRGSIDATELGVHPGALDDQSKAFAACCRRRPTATCRCSCRPASMSCPT